MKWIQKLLTIDNEFWVDANHPSFKNCIIDTSDNFHDGMNHVME
jgi:hypothetical protein